MSEPTADRRGAEIDADRVSDDVAAVAGLVAAGVEVDGEVQVVESTSAIYGHTRDDGEVIVGEYHDAAEAAELLRAAPRAHPDDGTSVP